MRILKLGSRGTDVQAWQVFLRGGQVNADGTCTAKECDSIISDGIFGLVTEKATKTWQTTQGLTADGIVGPATWAEAVKDSFPSDAVPVTKDTDPDTDVDPDPEAQTKPTEAHVDKTSAKWPPLPPGVKPLVSNASRQATFGTIEYVSAPRAGNPEAIHITNNWSKNNIAKFSIPLLSKNPISMHKAAGPQFIAWFAAIEAKGLADRVLSFAGCWVPRYVRGSRKTLSNHCLPAMQKIWTPTGLESIADMKGYDGRVWSYQGGQAVPSKVTGFFPNGKKRLLRIDAVGHDLTVSFDHPILVLRKKTLPKDQWIQHTTGRGSQRALYWTEMVEAQYLLPGDRVVAAAQMPELTSGANVDGRWAEILGLFIGDGCIHHLHGKPEYMTFCIPQGDRVRDHAIELMTEYFGEAPKFDAEGNSVYYKESIWSQFLPYDRKARDKDIPSEVWGWSALGQAMFVLGYLYSDGMVGACRSGTDGMDASAIYSFKTGSSIMAGNVKLLLTGLGFRVQKIHTTQPEDKVIMGVNTRSGTLYDVVAIDVHGVLNPGADPMYLERVRASAKHNASTTPSWGYDKIGPDFTHHMVRKIAQAGDAEVFDIEVEGDHNFITDGVVVSNSWGVAIDINVPWNGRGRQSALVGKKGCVRELAEICADFGIFWGGWYRGAPEDGMHFELNRIMSSDEITLALAKHVI